MDDLNLKALRLRTGLSVSAAARGAGLDATKIRLAERGIRPLTTYEAGVLVRYYEDWLRGPEEQIDIEHITVGSKFVN